MITKGTILIHLESTLSTNQYMIPDIFSQLDV